MLPTFKNYFFLTTITKVLIKAYKKVKSLENSGINEQLDRDTAKRILFTNRASLLVLILIQVYCFVYLFIGSYLLIFLSEILGLGWLLILFLNRNKFYYLSRIWAVVLANITIVIVTYVFSLKAGIQYYFIPAALGAQFLFRPSNKLAIFFTAFIPSILWVFCKLTFINEPLVDFSYNPILFDVIAHSSYVLSLFISAVFAYFHAFQNDIIENQLQLAKKEADSANLAKSKFISAMSHEIRTPINTIIGFSDLLSNSALDNNQKQQIDNVKAASQNLLFIINDILDYSELESGRIKRFDESFSIINVVKEIQDNLMPLAEKKGIGLTFETTGDVSPLYLSDKRIIKTIVYNLVQNAIKFTVLGAVKIVLNATKTTNNEQKISIAIHDTGIGFDTTYTEEIFNRFTQLSSDINRMYGGTGLGLAMVKEMAEILDGSIEVESQPGKGSIFTLHFDVKVNNESIDLAKPKNAKSLNGLKVMLAEDDMFTVLLMQEMLKKWGMNITIAGDGNEAVLNCEKMKFDVILMDIQMPNYDGIEATKHIKAEGLNQSTPIIGFTANVDSETKIKGLNAGMIGFVYKPIDKDELMRILTKFVN